MRAADYRSGLYDQRQLVRSLGPSSPRDESVRSADRTSVCARGLRASRYVCPLRVLSRRQTDAPGFSRIWETGWAHRFNAYAPEIFCLHSAGNRAKRYFR